MLDMHVEMGYNMLTRQEMIQVFRAIPAGLNAEAPASRVYHPHLARPGSPAVLFTSTTPQTGGMFDLWTQAVTLKELQRLRNTSEGVEIEQGEQGMKGRELQLVNAGKHVNPFSDIATGIVPSILHRPVPKPLSEIMGMKVDKTMIAKTDAEMLAKTGAEPKLDIAGDASSAPLPQIPQELVLEKGKWKKWWSYELLYGERPKKRHRKSKSKSKASAMDSKNSSESMPKAPTESSGAQQSSSQKDNPAQVASPIPSLPESIFTEQVDGTSKLERTESTAQDVGALLQLNKTDTTGQQGKADREDMLGYVPQNESPYSGVPSPFLPTVEQSPMRSSSEGSIQQPHPLSMTASASRMSSTPKMTPELFRGIEDYAAVLSRNSAGSTSTSGALGREYAVKGSASELTLSGIPGYSSFRSADELSRAGSTYYSSRDNGNASTSSYSPYQSADELTHLRDIRSGLVDTDTGSTSSYSPPQASTPQPFQPQVSPYEPHNQALSGMISEIQRSVDNLSETMTAAVRDTVRAELRESEENQAKEKKRQEQQTERELGSMSEDIRKIQEELHKIRGGPSGA
ncbi:hypothetical protein EJ04DRAFT_524964 [Polyplosphaeria fusca]|uniref:Uncharacterized protein n=1 Tax=Polyplosphaeria fusca TaxID=682080 RepID=A0A9P4UZW5_9PLEO|nr:hypothetical protein EJ04DRAFT_524964 [Polyplosphaeria fusca]